MTKKTDDLCFCLPALVVFLPLYYVVFQAKHNTSEAVYHDLLYKDHDFWWGYENGVIVREAQDIAWSLQLNDYQDKRLHFVYNTYYYVSLEKTDPYTTLVEFEKKHNVKCYSLEIYTYHSPWAFITKRKPIHLYTFMKAQYIRDSVTNSWKLQI